MTVLEYYPHRIVCLAAEAPEIIDRLGMFDHIVAVSSHARRPAAVRQLPKVGGFANPEEASARQSFTLAQQFALRLVQEEDELHRA